jgi:hypothetical protein
MLLKLENEWVDFDLPMLRELIGVWDTHLRKLNKELEQCLDPRGIGLCEDLFDRAEGIVGMGFVACQWYLSTTYGCLKIKKPDALKFGPTHPSGLTIAQIINHAANYWKHHEEWPVGKKDKSAARTIAAISKLGIDCERDCVLTCALASVSPSKEMQFAPLIGFLENWSKGISEQFDK